MALEPGQPAASRKKRNPLLNVRRTICRWREHGLTLTEIQTALASVYGVAPEAEQFGNVSDKIRSAQKVTQQAAKALASDSRCRDVVNFHLLQIAIFETLSKNETLSAIDVQRLAKALADYVKAVQVCNPQAPKTQSNTAIVEALQLLGLEIPPTKSD